SAYVRHHAESALVGLAGFEYETGDRLDRERTVERVHSTRTSLRRLRATLRTFPRSVSAPSSADDDLRFVARALSDVRASDVRSLSPVEMTDALAGSLRIGPAREVLAESLAARRRRAIQAVDRDRTEPPGGRAVELL